MNTFLVMKRKTNNMLSTTNDSHTFQEEEWFTCLNVFLGYLFPRFRENDLETGIFIPKREPKDPEHCSEGDFSFLHSATNAIYLENLYKFIKENELWSLFDIALPVGQTYDTWQHANVIFIQTNFRQKQSVSVSFHEAMFIMKFIRTNGWKEYSKTACVRL